MDRETLQTLTWIITIISFLGGVAGFLFKKIVVEPLQRSINALNDTLKEFKISTDRKIVLLEEEVDLLKLSKERHEEQLKTLFKRTEKGSA